MSTTRPLTPPAESDPKPAASNPATSQAASSTSTTATRPPTVYQRSFGTLASLAASNKHGEIIKLAEELDLNIEGHTDLTRLLIVVPLVLSYLTIEECQPARHVLMRLPGPLAKHDLSQGLTRLVVATSSRNYPAVYSASSSLIDVAKKLAPSLKDLVPVLDGMLQTFLDAFRQRTFFLLAKAYTSLPVALAEHHLGLATAQIVTAAQNQGWAYDSGSKILTPSFSKTTASSFQHSKSTLVTFNHIIDDVSRLESTL